MLLSFSHFARISAECSLYLGDGDDLGEVVTVQEGEEPARESPEVQEPVKKKAKIVKF